jgi:2-oxoglutarate ferredoxin oxidoreductase subunit beta
VFNSGAFSFATDKKVKQDNIVYLEHGKPLIFANGSKGIRVNEGSRPEIVDLDGSVQEDDLLFHDEKVAEPSLAFMLARMRYPEFPEPMGVFRAIEKPTYDEEVNQQVEDAIAEKGEGDLEKLFNRGDTWEVK